MRATSNDDSDDVWDINSSGLTLCAPASVDSGAPAGVTWYGNGAGCAGISPTVYFGQLARITLSCNVADGTSTAVSLVPLTASDFGSTFLQTGGSALDTSLGDPITITCGEGTPPATPPATDTPSMTPTISTPTHTSTPIGSLTATPSVPTPTMTLVPSRSVTASPTPIRTPTRTSTPAPPDCLAPGEKVSLAVGIVKRLGASAGDRDYRPRYDLNGDGTIDGFDLEAVASAPLCAHGRDG